MRIDLFLKESRIIKRRTLAKDYCVRELVLINGKIAKPSSEVKDGDIVNITFGEKKFNVRAVIEIVGKKERASYVQIES
jgi:ribosomal 50S subunit-recycling heat shock protein